MRDLNVKKNVVYGRFSNNSIIFTQKNVAAKVDL